ncbi:hypothetical protein TNCV_986821 [Trichonephila clavipes]|nr:hypothetical protein TNCV_986821 [Trichonephila clavipes]
MKSSALEQVVTIHSDMAAERADLVSSQAKPVELYSQKVMSGVKGTSSWDDSLPAWLLGRLSHCRGSQHDLAPTRRPQFSHIKLAPQF